MFPGGEYCGLQWKDVYFAKNTITNGADIVSVSEKLGHTDKAVTLRMYTHADQESIKRASQIFRNAIKQA